MQSAGLRDPPSAMNNSSGLIKMHLVPLNVSRHGFSQFNRLDLEQA